MKTTIALLSLALAPAAIAAPPPAAAKRPVEDTYHGQKVVDDYRWLEDGNSPDVQAWVKGQSEAAAAHLAKLPAAEPLLKRMLEIDEQRPPMVWPYRIGQTWYATQRMPGKRWPILARLTGPEDIASAKPIIDFNTIDPKGLTSPDFWVPSLDGKKLAVSLSKKGSEQGELTVYDVATMKPMPEHIPDVNKGTGGGGIAWLADSSGFYYTRYPKGDDFHMQVWLHKLGTPVEKDSYVFGKELPKIAEIYFVSNLDGTRLVIAVKNGDGGDEGYWLRDGAAFKPVAAFDAGVKEARFGLDGALYLRSVKDAPKGKLLRLAPGVADLARAEVVLPAGDKSIDNFTFTKTKLYVVLNDGGINELRVYGLDGKGGELVPTPPVSGVFSVQRIDPAKDEVLYAVSPYLEPFTVYRWAPGEKPRRSPLSITSKVDFSGYEVERAMVTSKDGTKVPLTLIHKKGMPRDGQQPTILNGYGGYGIGQRPFFDESRILWLEQGGALAYASLRGGDEYGEAWHQQGMLTRKQNVFDDFIACAEWLISSKVTSPKKLAIEGGSNGGLLMGAALTQRPELFGAVVSWVGIYDMLRVELSSNGQYNVTEFGTVKDPEQFRALYAYSPYHHVPEGGKVPPILLITGENDPRVDPMQSRKFAARLLAAGARDVLLLTNPDAGHGTPERMQAFRQAAYATAFMMDRLGMKPR